MTYTLTLTIAQKSPGALFQCTHAALHLLLPPSSALVSYSSCPLTTKQSERECFRAYIEQSKIKIKSYEGKTNIVLVM